MTHSPSSFPGRAYFFSDTYGGTGNPFTQPDADALISTDFGSRPDQSVHREFDIFGQEEITAHVLRLIIAKHDELADRLKAHLTFDTLHRAQQLKTGVFINAAPRIAPSEPEPFYLASLRSDAIRVVATPLSALAPIRNDVEELHVLREPNGQHNFCYEPGEQFRSQYTPGLLSDDRPPLGTRDPDIVPLPRTDWHISYIDRFGNIVTYAEDLDAQWRQIQQASASVRKFVRVALRVPGKGQQELTVQVSDGLNAGEPGTPIIYKNGKGIDIVRKWRSRETAADRMDKSAYHLLGGPQVGSQIKLVNEP